MVYKRYIHRNGKVYGPYIYRSKKKGNKVVSEYLGKPQTKKIGIFPFIIFGLILIILILLFLNYSSMTGFTISQEKTNEKVAFIRFLDEDLASNYTTENSTSSSKEVKE